MNFCKNCDNVLNLKVETVQYDGDVTKDELFHFCKNCNFKKKYTQNDNSCLFKINYNLDNIKKKAFINPYIYDDITLPRATGIKCPNVGCTKSNPEIVYINYDSSNMKYIYICLDCYKDKREPHIW